MSDASDTLSVDVNRTHLHSVEVPDSFETAGSFDVELENHGESVHVHVHLDDALSEVAAVEAVNHHLRPGATRQVPVAVYRDDRSVQGRLKVASAYGAETRYVDVSIDAVEPIKPPVEVDESLAKPHRRSPSQSASSGRSSGGEAGASSSLSSLLDPSVVAFGIVVLLLAAIAVVAIDNAMLLVGAFAVLAGLAFAGYLSLR